MKTLFFFLITTLAFAEPDIQPIGNGKYFKAITNLFNEAQPPQIKKLLGEYSGRCFIANKPEVIFPGYLKIFEDLSNDPGPIFNKEKPIQFLHLSKESYASYFDFLTQEKKTEVLTNTDGYPLSTTKAETAYDSFYHVSQNGSVADYMRVFENFIIVKSFKINEVEHVDLSVCYFYNKLN